MGGRDGIALATALFGVVVVTVLAMGMWTIARVNNLSAVNREDAARALNLAEAGVAHALSLLRGPLQATTLTNLLQGSDFAPGGGDDFLLIGHGLPVADMIPPEGVQMERGTYFVTLMDDPAHPREFDGDPLSDSNGRIIARCTGVTDTEASASINVVIGATSLPAMATDGSLTISGTPSILGDCGSVHANEIVVVNGSPTVSEFISASETVDVNGTIYQEGGGTSTPLSNQPPIEIPDLDPMDYCDTSPDPTGPQPPVPYFILRANGYFVTVGELSRDSVDANSTPVNGWTSGGTSNPVEWSLSGDATAEGSYCVVGGVLISGNPGTEAVPLAMSFFADGSVQVSGVANIKAKHSSGAFIVANGDVQMNGFSTWSEENYSGFIYAQSQCMLNGDMIIEGYILCKDDPNPPGSNDMVTENLLNGNPTIRYNCAGLSAGLRRILSWYQALGGT